MFKQSHDVEEEEEEFRVSKRNMRRGTEIIIIRRSA